MDATIIVQIVGMVFSTGMILGLAGIITGEMHTRRTHKLKMKESENALLAKQLELEIQSKQAIAIAPIKEKTIEEILSERFAKGEISEEEYTKMMDAILKHKGN